jgi:hypothetical protein
MRRTVFTTFALALDHMERPTAALHLTRVTLSLRQLGAEPHTKEVGRDEVYNHHCLRSARGHHGGRGVVAGSADAGAPSVDVGRSGNCKSGRCRESTGARAPFRRAVSKTIRVQLKVEQLQETVVLHGNAEQDRMREREQSVLFIGSGIFASRRFDPVLHVLGQSGDVPPIPKAS